MYKGVQTLVTKITIIKGELQVKCKLLLFKGALKMLRNDSVSPKSAKPFLRYEALKFKFPRKERKICFLHVSIKIEKNRNRDIIVDKDDEERNNLPCLRYLRISQSVRHIENTFTRLSWLSWQPDWNKTSLIENDTFL